MIGQGIQKHNPDSIDEGYITHSPTPTNFEDGAKEPRISKVVEAAKSFVQSKTVSPPLSSMGDPNTSNHLENIGKSAEQRNEKQ